MDISPNTLRMDNLSHPRVSNNDHMYETVKMIRGQFDHKRDIGVKFKRRIKVLIKLKQNMKNQYNNSNVV